MVLKGIYISSILGTRQLSPLTSRSKVHVVNWLMINMEINYPHESTDVRMDSTVFQSNDAFNTSLFRRIYECK